MSSLISLSNYLTSFHLQQIKKTNDVLRFNSSSIVKKKNLSVCNILYYRILKNDVNKHFPYDKSRVSRLDAAKSAKWILELVNLGIMETSWFVSET